MGGEGLKRGDRVGQYVVEACLGSGGMGDVYLVRHSGLDKLFAMKVFRRPDHARADEFAARFQLEIKTVAALDHPNIVTATDSGDLTGNPWFTMSYVEGVDGREAVTKSFPDGLPADQVVRILESIADALDYAHSKGLLHRDVKPGNIMLGANGRHYLTDFGIVKALSEPNPITTAAASPPKTLEFGSPEQQLDRPLGPPSDIYSLGATTYYLMTGRYPFEGDPIAQAYQHVHRAAPVPSQTKHDLPPEFDTIIAQAMAKNPAERFSTCHELAAATREAFHHRLSPTRPAPPPPGPVPLPTPVPPKPPRRRWLAAASVAALLAAGIGGWFLLHETTTTDDATRTTSTAQTAAVQTTESSGSGSVAAGSALPAVAASTGTSTTVPDANSPGDVPAPVVALESVLDPTPPTRSGTSGDQPVAGAAAIELAPHGCPGDVRTYPVDVGTGLSRITGTFLMSDTADPTTRTAVTVNADGATKAQKVVAPRAGATIDIDVTGVRDLSIELATAGSGDCTSGAYLIFLTNAQAFR